MWSNTLISMTVFAILYAIGKVISNKTKGIIVEALFLSIVYVIGFLTGIIPTNSLIDTGIPAVMSAWGTMLLVTNLGTMIELKRFVHEWKIVVICFGALAVMTALFYTVGIKIFGRYYALCALPPVAGGVVANALVVAAAENAGLSDYGAFASLVCSLQSFVAVPIASILFGKYVKKIYNDKAHLEDPMSNAKPWPSFRLIKSWPSDWNQGSMMMARLFLVCLLGTYISKWTNGTLPAVVLVLFLGIVFTELGFLERQTLTKAGFFSLLIMGLVMSLPNSFRNITLDSFVSMMFPIVGTLLLGAIGLIIGGILMGKLLKTDWRVAVACSLSAMFGYPLTEIIARAVVGSYKLPPEEEEQLLETVMPQLIIAGFTTVTIASVALAGFVAPTIFG